MNQFEMDPDRARSLAVIDATLAGDVVEPEHADLAELTLILAAQRQLPRRAFATELDARVARRFAGPDASAGARPARRSQRSRRRWLYAPSAAAGLAAAVALVVVLSNGGSRLDGPVLKAAPGIAASPAGVTSTASSAAAPGGAPQTFSSNSAAALPRTSRSPNVPGADAARHAPGTTASGSASASAPGALPPSPLQAASAAGGRQIVQSAQLALSTRPTRIDSVAEQVFVVIAAQNGVVDSSNVTAANNSSGYAQFELSVPSVNLGQTMAALSRLRGAAVVSRTDASQDVTGQLGGAGRRLADARALRTSLLRKLAIASTATAIDSLRLQIRDANASIAGDLATLRAMHRAVDLSAIALTINASTIPGHPVSGGSSFTLGGAAHDAGRVLVIAAGVALISLAALVPLAMLAGVVLWLGYAIRRRRREHALDLV
jgi:Domain of unknown function (DUF4349)